MVSIYVYIVFLIVIVVSFITGIILTIIEHKKTRKSQEENMNIEKPTQESIEINNMDTVEIDEEII